MSNIIEMFSTDVDMQDIILAEKIAILEDCNLDSVEETREKIHLSLRQLKAAVELLEDYSQQLDLACVTISELRQDVEGVN